MSLILRDSINPFDIPLNNLDAVAGYGDGLYMWSSEGWARFPPPIVPLSIVVNVAHVGDILDIEAGAAYPAEAPWWCDHFNRPGRRAPTLYVNRANWQAVRDAVGARQVDYWVATLDGTVDVPGAVAVQYCGASDSNDPCRTTGHYDESMILDPGWIGLPGGDPVTLDPTQQNELKGAYLDAHTTASLLALGVQTDPVTFQPVPTDPKWIVDQLAALNARLDALPVGGGLTAAQAQLLAAMAAAITRIEKALQNA